MTGDRIIGRVGEIWRYPVKSMLGEPLRSVAVERRGLVGDRVCAFLDERTGRVASAKLPHRWRALLSCRARYHERDVAIEVELPGGATVGPAAAAAALTRMLGRELRPIFARPAGIEVERADPDEVSRSGSDAVTSSVTGPIGIGAPEGGFFDAMPIHVVATPSLAAVARASGRPTPEPARFRPNIVIDSDGPPFEENRWAGGRLTIGTGVELAIVCPTPRCAVPALAHGRIAEDMTLPSTIAALNSVAVLDLGVRPSLGAYANIVRAGRIAVGDAVLWQAN